MQILGQFAEHIHSVRKDDPKLLEHKTEQYNTKTGSSACNVHAEHYANLN